MTEKDRRKLWIAAGTVAILLIVAAFTNPDQASHLRAIRETVALRKPAESHSVTDWLLPTVEYHNYLVFSTTRFSNMTFTYGYFGKIQTTNDIGVFYGVVPQ